MAYRNGFVPSSARRTVAGQSLYRPTANAAQRLIAAARDAGHTIGIYGPVGGYRSYAVQVDMHRPSRRAHYNIDPTFDLRRLAAPGASPHGFGLAVDFRADAAGRAWLQKNAGRFGFRWAIGRADPNHWVHDGHTAGSSILSTSSSGTTPAKPPTQKDHDMSVLIVRSGPKGVPVWGLVSLTEVETTSNKDIAERWRAQLGYSDAKLDYDVSDDKFAYFVDQASARADRLAARVAAMVPAGSGTGSISIQPILEAIANIPVRVDAQLDDEQAQLLAQLSALPDGVRANLITHLSK